MARRVSLYIEDNEIKLLVTNGSKVEKWASLMLDEGLVNEGVIQDEKRVAESVKQLFKLQKVAETSVVVGISGLNSVSRVISLPEVSRALLPEAVSNEAGRVLPMPLSQVYYSYQPLPSPKGELRLFLVAYPRNSTDALLNVIHEAGLKPLLMDLAPLALARCVNANRAILVNSWLNFVDIIVLNERVPLVIRSLSLPVEGTSLQERLTAISEELSRTITFFNSTYPDKPLDASTQMFVSGDVAQESDALTQFGKLGYPVAALKPPLDYKPVFNATQYMVNIGLALKGQLPKGAGSLYSMIDFNALPRAFEPPPFSWARVLIPVGAFVAVGVLGFGVLSLISLRSDSSLLTAQYNALQQQTGKMIADNKQAQTSLTAEQAQATALAAQAKDLQGQIDTASADQLFFTNTLANLKTNLDNSDRDVREIVQDAPTGISITDIDYQTDGVTIKGLATSQSLALAYARALRTGGRFGTVTITSIDALDGGVFGFAFILR